MRKPRQQKENDGQRNFDGTEMGSGPVREQEQMQEQAQDQEQDQEDEDDDEDTAPPPPPPWMQQRMLRRRSTSTMAARTRTMNVERNGDVCKHEYGHREEKSPARAECIDG